MGTESKTSARRLTAREREEMALTLRIEGKSYKEIARALEMSDGGAYKAVMRAIRRLNEKIDEDAATVKRMELERLDIMLAGIWPKVKAGRESAIDRALKIMERRAKFSGLDAPKAVDLTSGGEKLARFIWGTTKTDNEADG